MIEAIRIGLYDPDIRQLRDIKTGEILSSYDSVCDTDTQRRLIKMGVLKSPPMSLEQVSACGSGILGSFERIMGCLLLLISALLNYSTFFVGTLQQRH